MKKSLIIAGILVFPVIIVFGLRENYKYQEGVGYANLLTVCQVHFFSSLLSKYQIDYGEFPGDSQVHSLIKKDSSVADGCDGKSIQTKGGRIFDGYDNEILIDNRIDSVVVCLKEAFSGGVYGDVPYGVILTRDGKQEQFYGCLDESQ